METLALLTIGNDLAELLARRDRAGQTPSTDEVEAAKFVRDRLARLPQETPARSASDGPSRTPTTSDSAAAATIQWQDEFLNLLVRAARKVKRWLFEADKPSTPDVPDLSGLGDLRDRTNLRLRELLNQSPALLRLSSNRQLDGVARHLTRHGVGGTDHSRGGRPTNPFHGVSNEHSVRRGRVGALPPPETSGSGQVHLQQSRPRSPRR
ncbi:hypothetical protein [Micromonospora sp. NPDC005710]|uniref:hypothetical protein n=1 Tax=Micromonospora sp. NPDC005710 TaxID=3157051 RepID=UPI00341107E8